MTDISSDKAYTASQPAQTANGDVLHEQLRQIKQWLRSVMNGPVSQSMRDKGLNYKVNFGVELPRLSEKAQSLPHTYDLAAALWKEDIRECRLLAGMLMPVEAYDGELADVWIEQMRYPEEAECTVLNLFSRLPEASQKAFEWIAREQDMFRLCGWLLMGRLFAKGAVPQGRDVDELLDQLSAELHDTKASSAVQRAARKALLRFMDLGEEQERLADRIL